MRNTLHRYLLTAALLSAPGLAVANSCDNGAGAPYFALRSQSLNGARNLVGWANGYHIYLPEMCDFYASFSVTPEYTKSFRNDRLARCLFGDSLTTTDCDKASIKVSGSRVTTRGNRDWLAENFGLPRDFESTITVSPEVKQWLINFQLYLGFDNWVEGMYLRVYTPVVGSKWNLNACEKVNTKGTEGYIPGYFGPTNMDASNLNNSALQYLSGNGVKTISGSTVNQLDHSKWKLCDNNSKNDSDIKLADVRFAFGWNFLLCDDYHLGFDIRAAAPTGTKPDPEFFFAPVIGNGRHGELGVGFTGHVVMWRDEECDRSLAFWFDTNVTHLFKTSQCRSFDLCNSASSRYALAQKLKTNENGLQGQSGIVFTDATYQFADLFAPVANLTTATVDVSAGAQGEVTLLLDYTCGGFSWDLAYNFWGRSCEKIKCPCPSFAENMWALKGDAYVYGFTEDGTQENPPADLDNPFALSSTESKSSIFAGTNRPCGDPVIDNSPSDFVYNVGIDNPQRAFTGGEDNTALVIPTDANNTSSRPTNTSIQSIFIGQENVNYARTRGTSNQLVTHFSYTWCDCECWIPYLGVGGKGEWGGSCSKPCDTTSCPTINTTCATSCRTSCDTNGCDTSTNGTCNTCALSEWGVWVKGGVSFN